MAYIKADRIKEVSATPGAGAMTVSGAVFKYRPFSTVMANADNTHVLIEHATLNEWEICESVITISGGVVTLSRGTIKSSSNSGNRVTFSNGVKYISMLPPADAYLRMDNNGDMTITRDLTIGRNLAVTGTLGVTGATTLSTLGVTGAATFSSTVSVAGALNMNSQKITTLLDPTDAQDAATKFYVDATVQGLDPKTTARLATAAALPTCVYENGTAGAGATLTASANAALTVDGVAVAAGDFILVKNQASAFQNGLYTVTQAGSGVLPFILTRAPEMNSATEVVGAFVPVGNEGTANANTLWLCNPSGAVTMGTTNLPFTQLNGATALIPGTGISISGNTVSISPTTGTGNVVFSASPSLSGTVAITGGLNLGDTGNRLQITSTGSGAVFNQNDNSSIFFQIQGTTIGRFTPSGFALGSTGDVSVFRDAANVLAQRNAAAAQTFRVYNTYTDASNYERLELTYASNIAWLRGQAAGTGSGRPLRLSSDGITTIYIEDTANAPGAASVAVERSSTSGTTQFAVGGRGTGLTSTALLHTRLMPTINQASGTYTVLDINPTETAIGAGPHYLLRGRIGAGGNVFSVDRTGVVNSAAGVYQYNGTHLLRVSTNYTVITSPSGNDNFVAGNAVDATNYYRNTTHRFEAIGAASTYAILNSTGLGLGGIAPSYDLHISKAAAGAAVNVVVTNTDSTGSSQFIQGVSSRSVTRTVVYGSQYMHEVGSGVVTRYSDFDSHYFRKSNGTNVLVVGTDQIAVGAGSYGMVQHNGTDMYIRPTNAPSSLFLGASNTNWVGISGATGTLTSYAAGSPSFAYDNAAGSYRYMRWYSSGAPRWDMGVNNGTESGSSVGSDFYISRWSDGGVATTCMTIDRAAGIVTMTVPANGTRALNVGGPNTGIRVIPGTTYMAIESVDNTFVASYKELALNGTTVYLQSSGNTRLRAVAAGVEAYDLLDVFGVSNADSLRVRATGGTKFVVIKPETATDVAQLFYWNGAAAATLNIPGTLTTTTQTTGDNSTKVATTAFVQNSLTALLPTGTLLPNTGFSAPTGFLLCDGTAVSRATYATLFAWLTRSSTVTMTIASPCVVTWTAHPLVVGDKVSFETTGALPTGLAVGTNYYVISVTTNTFQISATPGGAAVNTSGTQSGTQTCRHNPWGCGNGTTTFNVPDLRGRTLIGADPTNAAARMGVLSTLPVLGATGGADTVTLTTGHLPAHAHGAGSLVAPAHNHGATGAGLVGNNLVNGTSRAVGTADGTNSGYYQDVIVTVSSNGPWSITGSTANAGSDTAHNNTQPSAACYIIIKY